MVCKHMISQTMTSGIPIFLGLGTSKSDPYVSQTTLHQGVNARPQVMASGVSAEFTGRCSIFDSFTPIHALMQVFPDGVVSGPKSVYPWGFCKLQGFCFTRTAKQSPGRAGEKKAVLQPILPIRASLAVFKASSTAARTGLASTRRLAKTCTWLNLELPRQSRLVRRSWPLARETSLSVALSPPTITT